MIFSLLNKIISLYVIGINTCTYVQMTLLIKVFKKANNSKYKYKHNIHSLFCL